MHGSQSGRLQNSKICTETGGSRPTKTATGRGSWEHTGDVPIADKKSTE